MPSTVTVTGKDVGGRTITAKVINNVKAFKMDCDRALLKVTDITDTDQDYDVSAATTITGTAAAGSYTFVIS